jgi:hypothetical protein
MQNRLSYLSLFFGIVSWSLLALNFTPLLGNTYDRVFLFFPPALFGLVLGIIAYFKCQKKKLAIIGILINVLPFGILALFTYLLTRPDAFRQ